MKQRTPPDRRLAFTLVEAFVLIVMVALVLLTLCILPPLHQAKAKAQRIACVSRLKQVGLAFRIWSADHDDRYPMQEYATNGGTLELVISDLAFPHFQVTSNELNAVLLLTCPADRKRCPASSWTSLANSNISYFLGLDASETNSSAFLAGDSNLEVDGKPVGPGIFNLWTNSAVAWTAARHNRYGNVALADGSVQQLSNAKLPEMLIHTGMATNRLAIP